MSTHTTVRGESLSAAQREQIRRLDMSYATVRVYGRLNDDQDLWVRCDQLGPDGGHYTVRSLRIARSGDISPL
jgi:hypothetical protein